MSKIENIKEAIRAIDIKSHKLAHRRGCLVEKLRRLEESAGVEARPRRSNNSLDTGTGRVLDRVLAEAKATEESKPYVTNGYPDPSDPYALGSTGDNLPDVDDIYASGPAPQLISGDDRVPTRPRRLR